MNTKPTAQLALPVSARDQPTHALVTLLEYGDYECPYCGEAHPTVEALRKVLGNRMRFVFRNFPLTQLHPHALLAAEAAEAVGESGKFWEMHDTLYENQDALDESHLLHYAALLGFEPAPLRRALEADDCKQRVKEDFASGARSGVNGTPTFFIEQFRYDGPRDFDSMLAFLEDVAEMRVPRELK